MPIGPSDVEAKHFIGVEQSTHFVARSWPLGLYANGRGLKLRGLGWHGQLGATT